MRRPRLKRLVLYILVGILIIYCMCENDEMRQVNLLQLKYRPARELGGDWMRNSSHEPKLPNSYNTDTVTEPGDDQDALAHNKVSQDDIQIDVGHSHGTAGQNQDAKNASQQAQGHLEGSLQSGPDSKPQAGLDSKSNTSLDSVVGMQPKFHLYSNLNSDVKRNSAENVNSKLNEYHTANSKDAKRLSISDGKKESEGGLVAIAPVRSEPEGGEDFPITANCLPLPSFNPPPPIQLKECGAPHVVMHDGGRLGNKMCQYLSLYLLRHLYGIRVSITEKMQKTLKETFRNITLPIQDPTCFTKRTKRIFYHDLYRLLYEAGQKTMQPGGSVTAPLLSKSYYVFHHPCPRDLILANRDLIRRVLVFKKEVLERAENNIAKALFRLKLTRQNVTLVTVHVRRGDYGKYLSKHYNFTQLDHVYFQRAFDFYRESCRVRRPVFVVVSDDLKWCKRVLRGDDVVVAGNRKDAKLDLALVTLGDHIVTSYGTFSFMGAMLGSGHLTHPISQNIRYKHLKCVSSPTIHYISRDKDYIYNNTGSLP